MAQGLGQSGPAGGQSATALSVLSRNLVQQVMSVLQTRLRVAHAAHHPGQLDLALGPADLSQTRAGDGSVGSLRDDDMGVGEGGDLGQVGDDDDLVTTCQLTQSPPNLDADRTSDTGVDLVEDEGLWGLGLCRDDLEGQPHSRQLTT